MLLKNITIIYRLVNKVKILSGSWEVFFSEEWGGPEKKLFPELISWTESEDF